MTFFDLPHDKYSRLNEFEQYLVVKFRPLLQQINPQMLSEESHIQLSETDYRFLSIVVSPKQLPIAGFGVFLSPVQLIVKFAEAEQFELHSGLITFGHIDNAIDLANKYLSGVIIKEFCNPKGLLVKREYYFSDGQCIGTSMYKFLFRKKSLVFKEFKLKLI